MEGKGSCAKEEEGNADDKEEDMGRTLWRRISLLQLIVLGWLRSLFNSVELSYRKQNSDPVLIAGGVLNLFCVTIHGYKLNKIINLTSKICVVCFEM